MSTSAARVHKPPVPRNKRRGGQPMRATLAIILCVALGWTGAYAAPPASQPAVQLGLAAKYPADAGIEKDPAVLFAENFEAGTIPEIAKRWGEAGNKAGKPLALAGEVPPVHRRSSAVPLFRRLSGMLAARAWNSLCGSTYRAMCWLFWPLAVGSGGWSRSIWM